MNARRIAGLIALVAMVTQPLGALAGGTGSTIVTDPNAGAQRPIVTGAGNGTPIVNITTPSGSGVSVNKFTTINVGTGGLIFNNSANPVNTQLAGSIAGNQFLGLVPAQIILNEVTSGNPSSILGYLEVAGQQAQLILANPNGITCSGCGFINTSRAMLTTGVPVFGANGALNGFNVTGGNITIGAGGIDASTASELDLSARSLSFLGPAYAPVINVIAGPNALNADGTFANTLPATGQAPQYAIDLAALGAMYANRIYLIANESGVGVNSAGTIAAQTGDVTISSSGMLTLGGQTSGNNVTTTSAGDTVVTGTVYGLQNATLTAQGALNNTGLIGAQGNVTVNAATVASSGTFASGLQSNGTLGTSGDLQITTPGSLAANGTNVAAGNIALSAASIDLSNSSTNAGSALTATSGGDLSAAGGQLVSGLTTSLSAAGTIDTSNGVVQSGTALALSASAINNIGGSIVSLSQDGLSIAANAVSSSGTIAGNGNVNIAASAGIANSGTIAAAQAANLTSPLLDNSGGTIGGAAVALLTANLTNVAGSITQSGSGPETIGVSGMLNNTAGTIATNATNLTLAPATLMNAGGTIAHAGSGVLAVSAGTIDNTAGTIATNGSANVTGTQSLTNAQGTLQALGTATVSTPALTNTGGKIAASGISVTTGSLANAGGTIAQSGSGPTTLAVSGTLDNTSGTIQTAADDLTLTPQTLINTGGNILHSGNGTLGITTPNTLANAGGTIASLGTVALTAPSIDNTGGTINGAQLALATGDLTNAGGSLIQTGSGAFGFNVTGTLDNTGGTLATGSTNWTLAPSALINNGGALLHTGTGTFTINTGNLSNTGGEIETAGSLALSATALTNLGGTISALNALGISAATTIDNTGGQVAAGGTATLAAGTTLTNAGGGIGAATLDLSAVSLANAAGTLAQSGTNTTTLAFTGAVDNTNGTISSAGTNVNFTGGAVTNTGGTIQHTGTGTLSAQFTGALTNGGGTIETNGDLNLAAASIGGSGGQVTAAGTTTIDVSGTFDNTGSSVQAGTSAALTAGTLSNGAGGTIGANTVLALNVGSGSNAGLISAGTTTINGGSFNNTGALLTGTSLTTGLSGAFANGSGSVLAGTTIGITAGSLTNGSGSIQSGMGLTVTAGSLTNAGTIASLSADGLSLTTTGALANTGTIGGNGNITVGAGAFTNAGAISAAGTFNANVTSLDNSNGTIDADQLTITAGSLTNTAGAIRQSGSGTTQIAVSGALANNTGLIGTNATNLTLDPASFLNSAGGTIALAGAGTLTIDAGSTLENDGTLSTNGALSLAAPSITNTGTALATNTATIATSGAFTNSGTFGGNVVSIGLTGLLNNSGTIAASQGLTVNSGSLTNAGTIENAGAQPLTIATGALTNTGTILSNGTTGLTTSSLSNAGGTLSSVGAVTINDANGVDNTGGTIVSSDSVTLGTNGALTNIGGVIQAGNALTVNAGSIDNTNGHLQNIGSGTTNVTATNALVNDGGVLGGLSDVNVSASTLSNVGGSISAGGNLGITATQSFDNTSGNTYAAGTLTLNVPTLTNESGFLGSHLDATLSSTTLDNTSGNIASDNDVNLTSTSGLGGTGAGTIAAGNNLTLNLGGDLALSGQTNFSADNTLTLNLTGNLTNGGTLESSGSLTLNAATLNNSGTIGANSTLTVDTSGDITNSGTLEGSTLSTSSADLWNTGSIFADNATLVAAGIVSNVGAEASSVSAPGNLTTFDAIGQAQQLYDAITSLAPGFGTSTYASGVTSILAGEGWNGSELAAIAASLTEPALDFTGVSPQGYMVAFDPNSSAFQISWKPGVGWDYSNPGLGIGVLADRLNGSNPPSSLAIAVSEYESHFGGVPAKTLAEYLGTDADNISYQTALTAVNSYIQSAQSAAPSLPSQPSGPAVNGNSGTIATTQTLNVNAGELDNTNNGLIYSLGNVVITAGTVLNSSATIQAAGDVSITATTLNNYITQFNLGSALAALSADDNNTYATFNPYISSSTGQAQILSGGDINLNLGTLNNDSVIAAGNNLNFVIGTMNVIDDTPQAAFTIANGQYNGSSVQAPYGSNLGPVFSATDSVNGTSTTINSVNAPVVPTGVGGGSVSRAASAGNGSGAGPGNAGSVGAGTTTRGTGPSVVDVVATAGSGIRGPQAGSEVIASAPTEAAGSAPASATAAASPTSGATAVAGMPSLTLPTSGLFTINPGGKFLITTAAAFANNGPSSAQLISAVDPQYGGAILGDAFYEQQLVNQQVLQLTGVAYLPGYTTTDSEYAALLSNGVQYAQEMNLQLGVALTPQQMAQLTSDMVWMVSETVDGESVLVPVVYLADVGPNDLRPNGSLIAGGNINIETGSLDNVGTIASQNRTQIVSTGTIVNNGTIASNGVTALSAAGDINNAANGTISSGVATQLSAGGNIANAGTIGSLGDVSLNAGGNITNAVTGTINAGGDAALIAGGNITDNGGAIKAGNNLGLQAGGDITVAPIIQRTAIGFIGTQQTVTNQGLLSAGNNLTLLTPGNINLVAANLTAGSGVTLSGGNVNIGTALNSSTFAFSTQNSSGSGTQQQVVSTNIGAGGDLNIGATNNVSIVGSIATAGGALNVAAGGNVSITNDTNQNASALTTTATTSGFLSSTTTTVSNSSSSNTAAPSMLAGNTVNVSAGNDVNVTGSMIVGTGGDVALTAGGNLNINAAQETASNNESISKTSSGFSFAPSGIGIQFGTTNSAQGAQGTTVTQSASHIDSMGGDVTLNANGDTAITASTIKASGNVNIGGANVTIDAAQNTTTTTTTSSQSFSGFSLGFTNSAITAGTQALTDEQQAQPVQSKELQALLTFEAGQQAAQITGDLASKATIDKGSTVTLSFGSTSSSSSTTKDTSTAVGSTITGANVNIDARSGDVDLTGSAVTAIGNVAISAAQNINLDAAQSTTSTNTSTQSSGFSIGAAVKLNGTPPTVTVKENSSNGAINGDTSTAVATVVTAGGSVALSSGADLNVIGSLVNANAINATVGGNLNIASLQNTNNYSSQSTSQSASLGVTVGTGAVTGTLAVSDNSLNAAWTSVVAQAGFFAGSGGYDLNVAGNTNLVGAVIASTAVPSANSLTTGTLTTSDLTNTSSYSGQNVGFNLGYTSQAPDKNAVKGVTAQPPSAINASGNASSTTSSGISNGTITITNAAGQEALTGQTVAQVVAGINHDVSGGANALGLNNITAIQQNMTAAGIIGSEANQLLTYEQGQIQKDRTANTAASNAAADQLSSLWGAGGVDKQIVAALAGAFTGNATASFGQVLQAGVGNYVEQLGSTAIGDLVTLGVAPDSSPLNVILHAVNGCIGAVVGGESCGSAALGAGVAAGVGAIVVAATTSPNLGAQLNEQQNAENLIETIAGGIGLASGGSNVSTVVNSAEASADNNVIVTRQQATTWVNTIKNNCGLNCFIGATSTLAGQSLANDASFTYGFVQGVLGSVGNAAQLARYLYDAGANSYFSGCVFDCQYYNTVTTQLQTALSNLGSLPNAAVNTLTSGIQQAMATADDGSLAQMQAAGQTVGSLVGNALLVKGAGAALGAAQAAVATAGSIAETAATTAESAAVLSGAAFEENAAPFLSTVGKPVFASDGFPIVPTPGVTTTVLGQFNPDLDGIINGQLGLQQTTSYEAANPGGINVLNMPNSVYGSMTPQQFWTTYNQPFLSAAIQRGDNIVLATPPTTLGALENADGSLTGFGQEYQYLVNNGYTYNPVTRAMVKGAGN